MRIDTNISLNTPTAFKIRCLNDDTFPADYVSGFSPDNETLKISLLSPKTEETEKWIKTIPAKKRFDFEISSKNPSSEEKFLVLNAKLTNKNFTVEHGSDRPYLTWNLEFNHSYFGDDKPAQVLTIDGKEYTSHGFLPADDKNKNMRFLLKQQKELIKFKTESFFIREDDYLNFKLSGNNEIKLKAEGVFVEGWLSVDIWMIESKPIEKSISGRFAFDRVQN